MPSQLAGASAGGRGLKMIKAALVAKAAHETLYLSNLRQPVINQIFF